MILRLLFSDRAIVIDENECGVVVWIYIACSAFVSGAKIALQSRILSGFAFVGTLIGLERTFGSYSGKVVFDGVSC
jgi:hypothetical protein